MSQIVLARKYRPKTFDEVFGQEHITTALKNAIISNRIHHAYLLTGSRGIGKTTIARIFAKTLNCEKLKDMQPCLSCESCSAIDSGGSLDFVEIDGASKTRIEDTKEIIDNISYATAKHRYKIYLIDEVHMLSLHSFNALLKTLEEPPNHVKFILATTEPHKIPITVLSRCLKFSLNLLSETTLINYLNLICAKEDLKIEESGINLLAHSAKGSVRDALTLLDQALLLKNNNTIATNNIENILGIDHTVSPNKILEAIINSQKKTILEISAELKNKNIVFSRVIEQLLTHIHKQVLHSTDVTLLKIFDIILKNKEYLTLAPNEYIGFEMLLFQAMPNLEPITKKKNIIWDDVIPNLKISQPTAATAEHLILTEHSPRLWKFKVHPNYQSLINEAFKQRLQHAISEFYTTDISIEISIEQSECKTPAHNKVLQRQTQLENLQHNANEDPFLKSICEVFNATIDYNLEK